MVHNSSLCFVVDMESCKSTCGGMKTEQKVTRPQSVLVKTEQKVTRPQSVRVPNLFFEDYFRNIINIIEAAPFYSPIICDKIGREILSILQAVSYELHTVSMANKRNIAENILKYIEENLNRKFTIEELGQNCFLGKTQLIKIFKDKYGVTPIKYAQLQRIEMAKYYLSRTDEPISTLHNKLGFEDVKYFSKLFKKITGISPSEYRVKKAAFKTDDYGPSGKFDADLRRY